MTTPEASRFSVPRETYGVVGAICALVAIAFMVTYSGPYRFFADMQHASRTGNSVIVSLLLTAVVIVLPMWGAVYLLAHRFGTRDTSLTLIWSNFEYAFSTPAGRFMALGLMVVVGGLFVAVKEAGRGGLTSLSVADLENGIAPRSGYVTLVDGTLQRDRELRMTVSGNSSTKTYRYIPVVDHARRPMLFLRLPLLERLPASGVIRGVLDQDSMDGELHSQLVDANAIAPTHYVLHVGVEPNAKSAMELVLLGVALMIGGAIWWRKKFAAALQD